MLFQVSEEIGSLTLVLHTFSPLGTATELLMTF